MFFNCNKISVLDNAVLFIKAVNEKEQKLEQVLKAIEIQMQKDPEQEERMRLETFRKNINEEIPDFMPGQVKLVEAHKKVGILQTDIDWVNQHKQGFICTPPRNKVKGDFRLVGFRVSRVGKVFFEGRSKRE